MPVSYTHLDHDMSIDRVREYFKQYGMGDRILEFPVSSAPVELAAQARGWEPCRIAKALSFMVGEEPVLIVMAGDVKIDNAKYKAKFGKKAKMLTMDEVVALIGDVYKRQIMNFSISSCVFWEETSFLVHKNSTARG